MSDETPDKGGAPGTTEADDAPTAEMPRIPGPGRQPAQPAKRPTQAAANKSSEVSDGKDDAKPAENSAAKAPAQSRPADAKPAESKPVESKAAETTPADQPAATKAVDTKPADTKPAATKAADTKPAATKTAETKPAETKPTDVSVAKTTENRSTPTTPTRPVGNKPPTGAGSANGSKPADQPRTSPDSKEGNDTKMTFSERVAASVPASLRNPKPVVKATPQGNSGSGAAAASRPITAGEYARTTDPSPSTTAVIPAVRDDMPKSSGAAAAATAASGRQASLKLVRVDPWSVTKVTFALTVALMIVAVVAITILWIVLSFAGVWDQINSSVTTVLSDDSNSFDITEYLGFGRIVGLTLVISAINVVITTAVATIGAYLYNLAAQLLGGFDITLAEDN